MGKFKLHYFRAAPNFGDMMNVTILERLLRQDFISVCQEKADLIAIGSILEEFLEDPKLSVAHRFFHKKLSSKLNVWGSGFICKTEQPKEKFTREMVFHAVRGRYTKTRLEAIYGKELPNVVIGDPGLLIGLVLSGIRVKKRYPLGIMPHYADKNDPEVLSLHEKIKHSKIIDVQSDVVETMKSIAECEVIVSSTLHGLIAADSLGIPNMWMKVSDKLRGGDYKFRDYYSVFDLEPRKIEDIANVDIGGIADSYDIKPSQVKGVQRSLLKAFPGEISGLLN